MQAHAHRYNIEQTGTLVYNLLFQALPRILKGKNQGEGGIRGLQEKKEEKIFNLDWGVVKE